MQIMDLYYTKQIERLYIVLGSSHSCISAYSDMITLHKQGWWQIQQDM